VKAVQDCCQVSDITHLAISGDNTGVGNIELRLPRIKCLLY
jgi:hypothetical protein